MPPGPHFSLKSLTNVIAFTLACQSYIGLAEENVEFNT
jgi:outer membrane usher protein PapC